ncbi:MAG: hypothetical protein ACM3SR_08040 [Ignavibacteriales bacterium]
MNILITLQNRITLVLILILFSPMFFILSFTVLEKERGVGNYVGTEAEFGHGDVSHLPPGYDAWVIGNEPVVVIDITGMTHYAE